MLILRKSMLLLSGLVLVPGLVGAQGVLRDPTMPPPGVKIPGPSAGATGDEGEARAVVAQSIIRITPVGGRRQAVIDGRALQTGEQVKQWRLVSISANGVVLKDSRGTRSVPTPASSVSKKPVSGSASAK